MLNLSLQDKLRIGLSELSLLEALACAAAYAEKHSVSCGSFQSDLSKVCGEGQVHFISTSPCIIVIGIVLLICVNILNGGVGKEVKTYI